MTGTQATRKEGKSAGGLEDSKEGKILGPRKMQKGPGKGPIIRAGKGKGSIEGKGQRSTTGEIEQTERIGEIGEIEVIEAKEVIGEIEIEIEGKEETEDTEKTEEETETETETTEGKGPIIESIDREDSRSDLRGKIDPSISRDPASKSRPRRMKIIDDLYNL